MKVETWDLFFSLFRHECMFSHVWPFATSWTEAHQAPLAMEFPRQEHWRELPFPPPEDQNSFCFGVGYRTSWADLNNQPHPSLNFPMKGFCGNLLKSLELLRHKSPVPSVTLWPLLQTPAFSYYLALVSFRYTGIYHSVTWLLTTCQYFKIQFVSWY